jgi:hypothetical protein
LDPWRCGLLKKRIKFDRSASPPIVIYETVKLASQAIEGSFRNAHFANPIYLGHYLSHEGIKSTEAHYRSLEISRLPMHLCTTKLLHKKIEKYKNQAD